MATQSDRAKRAAATKAFKQRQQELDDQVLIESTRQPRQAKTKALETAVWNGTSQKRAASKSPERAPKKSKGGGAKFVSRLRSSVPQENHPGKADSKQASTVNRKQTETLKQTKQRLPAAEIRESSSESDQDEVPVILPPKIVRTKLGDRKNEIKVPQVRISDELDTQESDTSGHSSETQDSVSDEDDLLDIESKDLRKVLSDEQPTILKPDSEAEDNSDLGYASADNVSDHDVDMIPADRDIVMSDNEDREPQAEDHQSNHHRKSSKLDSSSQSISVRRQKAFLAEKPSIQKTVSGNMKKEKKSKLTSPNIVEWPQHASLVLPSAGKSILLNNQHVYVAHVVRRAIAMLTEETLLIDAFLDVDKKINYHRRLLIETAHKLMSEIPLIEDIYDRLKEDINFCDALGRLVTDRLSVIRGPVKTHALIEVAAYELGKGDKCIERVEALFDRLVFIFPGSWTIDTKTKKEQWKFKPNKPFLNSVIIDVIRLSFFNSPRAIGYQIIKKCVSTLDGHDEPELPKGLVALACTGIYAALDEWKTGSKVTAKFEGNMFAAIYKAVCRNLEGIKSQNPKAYHVIMAELYTLAVTKPTAPSESEDALQVMDLTGF